MKRDFTGETVFSTLFRLFYAFKLRVRGIFFAKLFYRTPFSITIGAGVLLVNPKGIQVGRGTHFGRFARLETFQLNENVTPRVQIGRNCSFGDYFHVSSVNSIVIGDGCLVASKVLIIDNAHGRSGDLTLRSLPPVDRPIFSKAGIKIGKNVWIGECCTIFSGADVPDGAVVPAHSFVTANFSEYK